MMRITSSDLRDAIVALNDAAAHVNDHLDTLPFPTNNDEADARHQLVAALHAILNAATLLNGAPLQPGRAR